jgi:hypothetical protein
LRQDQLTSPVETSPANAHPADARPAIDWLYDGSAGGKGEGLIALAGLTSSQAGPGSGNQQTPGLACTIPRTGIVGTRAWEEFITTNTLASLSAETTGYPARRTTYLDAELPEALVDSLERFLPPRGRPLMVRSSSVLEDHTDTPFAGIYESYALPNSHPDDETRLQQLCDAVKLVYASLYSPGAMAYRSAVSSPVAGESMAVIIQELVGRKRGRWFYPLISGTAQSLNYYAISHAKPEDGLCTAALGLGTYVVEGGATQQFCPKWPGIQAVPPELAGSGSQTSFCALDAELDEPELVEGVHATLGELSLADAEGMGALDYVASTWDRDDLRLVPGASVEGPRIIDLGPILKYDALPLAPAISAALAASEELTDGPVELEYALDEAPDGSGPTLYLLQLKKLRRPGAVSALDFEAAFEINGGATSGGTADEGTTDPGTCIIRSGQAMGDGIIKGITDIVWLGHDSFDRSRSMEAAEEVATLDRGLRAEGRTYILIGPGRWGSRDPWLGVPVDYSQITNASVIVETEMPGLSVDFSFGSHFMRNVTGRGIGYLAIPDGGTSMVDWDYIGSLPKVTTLRYATHSRCPAPLEVLIDGVGRRALVRVRPLQV